MKPTAEPLIIPLSESEIIEGHERLYRFGDPGVFVGNQTTPEGLQIIYAKASGACPPGAATRVERNLGIPIVLDTLFDPTEQTARLIRSLGNLAGSSTRDTEKAISWFYGSFDRDIGYTTRAVRATAQRDFGALKFVLDIWLPAGTQQADNGEVTAPKVLTANYSRPPGKANGRAYSARILSPAVRLIQSNK